MKFNLLTEVMENQSTIVLNENIVAVLNELRTSVLNAQQTITSVNNRMTDILTGVCLSNGVDIAKQAIRLSEDLKSLIIEDLPSKSNTETTDVESVPRNTIKARRRKM